MAIETVGDLIKYLKKFDKNRPVHVAGRDENDDYFGYEITEVKSFSDSFDESPIEIVIGEQIMG